MGLTDLLTETGAPVTCARSIQGHGSVVGLVVGLVVAATAFFFADALVDVFVATVGGAGGSAGFVRRVPALLFVSGNTSGVSITMPNTSAS